ncbi:PREDICTED: uncharacterized protein LOC106912409 isoform X3 [Poecilia mexicana]|uniref:uncharacterized protein LOC106912409 isoform X3 n=1 Tax=Poecilia mexicana TaxID=48701 RepID=UPI00072E43CA|nr:PREDICTED: uncharacterized protein LOC106912409 isoform X3 [Poecilia mexicana]
MAAFRWIKRILIVMLMLQFIAQTETQPTFLTVRGGNEVTLPCGRDKHDESDETIWLFNDRQKSETRELVKLGNYHREMKTISDRLSVTANGSLLLRDVREDDVGQYTCQLTRSGPQYRFVVFLSVIKFTELKNPDTVNLFCSVLEYDDCVHEVKWLYERKEEKPSDMEISPHACSATVTFPTSHLHQKLDINQSLTCKVTNTVTKSVQLFPFSPQVSEENQTETTEEVDKTTNSADFPSASFPWRYIIVPLCLAMVLMAVLVIIRWNRNKGNKTQTEDIMVPQNKAATKQDLNQETSVCPEASHNTIESEDGLSYASINFKKSKKKTGNVPETVIYSAVGTFSSSAGVSSDTDCLYSTVNKK